MQIHDLTATPANVHWGYFDHALRPALEIDPGDVVRIETITHQAGDAPELMMDDAIREIFAQVTDRGPGPHLLTGPIFVRGARPGDTLEVTILSLEPRLPYGANLAAHWGHLYEEFAKERVTIYGFDLDAGLAHAEFAYDWTVTPLADAPGIVVPPESITPVPALEGVHIPLRPHFGTMGVAPAAPGRHHSVPPGDHGGNIDNWRIGAGATMHYPVLVEGALLSAGDPHVSQGDGEVSGTALEASLTGLLRIDVRRDLGFGHPVMETPSTWTVHGFGDDLDAAMKQAALRLVDLICSRFGTSRDDAYSLMSVACDFVVTQVVDQKQGVHATVSKHLFTGCDR